MRSPFAKLVCVAALASALLVGTGSAVSAASGLPQIVVTTLADDMVTNGNCTLREAIGAVEKQVTVDACPAGDSSTIITLPVGTITLSLGRLTIGGPTRIQGASGGQSQINVPLVGGDPNFKNTFTIDPAGSLSLSSVNIFGNYGSAIRNDGIFSGDNVRLTANIGDNTTCTDYTCSDDGNEGAAITNYGRASCVHCRIDHGDTDVYDPSISAALYNSSGAVLSILDSTIDNNVPSYATAVLINLGTAEIKRTIIDQNQSLPFIAYYFQGYVINSPGPLSIESSRITSNAGFGIIQAGAALRLSNDTVQGNIAALDATIAANATTSVADTWIDSNQGSTGGLRSYGTLTMLRSTVSSNGGGACGESTGGLSIFGSATITNSTIDGNSGSAVGGGGICDDVVNAPAAGGIIIGGAARLLNVTITNNAVISAQPIDNGNPDNHPKPAKAAGGLLALPGANVTMADTIVSGNRGLYGTPDSEYVAAPDCQGAVTSNGYNLVGDIKSCGLTGGSGNITGIAATLGPLQMNGGRTPTRAPLKGSATIDSGSPAAPGGPSIGACNVADQRTVRRPLDGNGDGIKRCDIGAVET